MNCWATFAAAPHYLVKPDFTPPIPRHVFKYQRYAATPEEGHHDGSQQKDDVDEYPHLRPQPKERKGKIDKPDLGRKCTQTFFLRQKENNLHRANAYHSVIARGPARDCSNNESQRCRPKPPANVCRVNF